MGEKYFFESKTVARAKPGHGYCHTRNAGDAWAFTWRIKSAI